MSGGLESRREDQAAYRGAIRQCPVAVPMSGGLGGGTGLLDWSGLLVGIQISLTRRCENSAIFGYSLHGYTTADPSLQKKTDQVVLAPDRQTGRGRSASHHRHYPTEIASGEQMPKPGEVKWHVLVPAAVKDLGARLRRPECDERLNGITIRMVVRMAAMDRLWPTLPEPMKQAILAAEEQVQKELEVRQDELQRSGGGSNLQRGRPLTRT